MPVSGGGFEELFAMILAVVDLNVAWEYYSARCSSSMGRCPFLA